VDVTKEDSYGRQNWYQRVVGNTENRAEKTRTTEGQSVEMSLRTYLKGIRMIRRAKLSCKKKRYCSTCSYKQSWPAVSQDIVLLVRMCPRLDRRSTRIY
jgi:hypothetical protein